MATQKKIDSVVNLTDKLARAKAFILVDYRGLKHKQLEDLRKILKKSNAEFTVAKNRLFLKALGEKSSTLVGFLHDTTAMLFEYQDEVAPLKEVLKFFKLAGFGKIKAGVMGVSVLSDTEVIRFASLPSRQILLGQLVGQLNAPIQGLHNALSWNVRKLVYALNQIQSSKSK